MYAILRLQEAYLDTSYKTTLYKETKYGKIKVLDNGKESTIDDIFFGFI